MTKFLPLVLLCIFSISCNNQNCSESSSQKQSEKPLAATCDPTGGPIETDPGAEPNGEVPEEAYLFAANLNFTSFDRADEDKVYKAIDIIKKVVTSSEFKLKVLGFTFDGKRSFVDNKGLNNEQIYQKLLEGAEELRPELDHEMDLELELYYSRTSTVGYTYPDGLRIWMNTKFFDSYTPSEVAGNIFHEWTHKLGFDHDSKYSLSRDSSVPYALGYLIEELGKKYE